MILNKKWFSFLTVFFLFLFSLTSVFAYEIPKRDESYYVNDYAHVISENEKNELIALNQELNEKTGAEIVVVTVDFVHGSIEDYSYQLFNQWQIGDQDQDNGLLLVLSIGDEDYYACMGVGLEEKLSVAQLQDFLDNDLEEDFANENYGQGVLKFTRQVKNYIEKSYYQPTQNNEESDFIWFLFSIFAILIIIFLLYFFIRITKRSYFPRTRRYRTYRPRPFYGPSRRPIYYDNRHQPERPSSPFSGSFFQGGGSTHSKSGFSNRAPSGGGRSRGSGAGRRK